MGRLDDLSERLFFYTAVICLRKKIPTDFFMKIRMGSLFDFFHFLPKHCDHVCDKLHLILYLCNTDPSLAEFFGGSEQRTGGRWWRASLFFKVYGFGLIIAPFSNGATADQLSPVGSCVFNRISGFHVNRSQIHWKQLRVNENLNRAQGVGAL